MLLDNLLKEKQFHTAELHEIAEALTKPAVRKYFEQQQIKALKSIVSGQPKEGESDSAYLRREAEVRGVLSLLEVLLEIQSPAQAGESQS